MRTSFSSIWRVTSSPGSAARGAAPISHFRTFAVLALVLGGLILTQSAAAQSRRYDGQVIQRVEYVGLRGLPAETMDYYLFGGRGAERGRLDLAELNRRIKTLWDRELIDDIKVEAEQVAGGVALVIEVAERPVLMSIN